jgi:hypothetical protein
LLAIGAFPDEEDLMLRCLKDLGRYTVSATDGEIGRVVDFLLDDQRWAIRYLVVDTGGGFLEMNGERVLISPIAFGDADWLSQRFHLALTKDKIAHSPGVDLHKPVSRQHEREYSRYYGYPYYWGYTGMWGLGSYPGFLYASDVPTEEDKEPAGDAHLRSAHEVRGYHIQGTDAAIGHLEDFIVDDETWEIRYLAVDTRDWWFGKKVLVAPSWTSSVDWGARRIHVEMTRQEIKDSPPWEADAPINREYETRLYDYHGRPVYWPSSAEGRGLPRDGIQPGA